MVKGKQQVRSTNKKPENTAEQQSKENNPTLNTDSCTTQSLFQRPSKSRSPLSDSSRVLIQERNESDAIKTESSKPKKDKSSEINGESDESKEDQKPEMPSHSHRTKVQTTDACEGKVFSTNTGTTAENKPSASKTQSARRRKPGVKKRGNKASQNRKVTDYYPIRRSNRKTQGELKDEEHKHIDDLIKNDVEEGLQVKHTEGKGRGVFALRDFKKGAFVVEYHGDLLEVTEAKKREAEYAQDPQTGCYMYYFQYQTKTYCVDATKETDRLGRLINHSKNGNCQTKLHAINGTPHLILVASRDIEENEELLYDYGDRSKASILAHPWLKY
ncbi:lysine methyltransferase 5Ab [Thalassophryne amazonica]|uniref:lysine methyltransferase 5Ab n=1 Tax=Thalassophryne amazonica TaxID=390379 RepID=UPI001470E5C3|nr:lysine methyltransferase 5Ab [Thalassophryne amazonica]